MMNTTYRPTWAEINLANLRFNYLRLKRLAGKNVKMLAAVKANAYGHGMIEVSRTLERCGVDYLGVASVDEALQLRRSGIRAPILVLGAVFSPEEIRQAVAGKVTLTVADYRTALKMQRCVCRGTALKVHIKVDTGMGRLGIWHEEALTVIRRISRLRSLTIEGIYTHCPSADTDRVFTARQFAAFESLLTHTQAHNISISLAHAANSSALCCGPRSACTMVRPGLMLYGMYPHPRLKNKVSLKPVLSLRTRITFLKKVPAGRSISYGRTYVTK
ncbi:MAG: alanine racemase, partial [Candidatus Omnitrophica bacterium]|nr:alanine racemase [Candidatus Omnitrophota bacterium]